MSQSHSIVSLSQVLLSFDQFCYRKKYQVNAFTYGRRKFNVCWSKLATGLWQFAAIFYLFSRHNFAGVTSICFSERPLKMFQKIWDISGDKLSGRRSLDVPVCPCVRMCKSYWLAWNLKIHRVCRHICFYRNHNFNFYWPVFTRDIPNQTLLFHEGKYSINLAGLYLDCRYCISYKASDPWKTSIRLDYNKFSLWNNSFVFIFYVRFDVFQSEETVEKHASFTKFNRKSCSCKACT